MRIYRSRRIKASTREHIADAIIGALTAVVVFLISLAVLSQLGIAL